MMACVYNFFCKAGHQLLQNELYPLLLVSILALVPLTTCFIPIIIALIALKQGSYPGLKVLIIGTAITLFTVKNSMVSAYYLPNIITIFSLSYFSALLLRMTENLKKVSMALVAIGLVWIVVLQMFFADYILQQIKILMSAVVHALPIENLPKELISFTAVSFKGDRVLANFLLGINTTYMVFSAFFSMLIARFWQAKLFYPQGFRQEILTFRASYVGFILFAISLFCYRYTDSAIAKSCIILLINYLTMAGMYIVFVIVLNINRGYKLILFLFSLVFFKLTLPIYVLLGSIDSFYDIRMRFLNASNVAKTNKKDGES